MENNKIDVNSYAFLYKYVKKHALLSNLANTQLALPLVRDLVIDDQISESTFQHCLMICRMMIDLNMQLTEEERDILLASAICHILPEQMDQDQEKLKSLLLVKHQMDPQIYYIIRLIYKMESAPEADLPYWYEKIQENKLALLITISDRGNMVEQLHDMNGWQVRRFIYETRSYYLPMCIYAKEHYHELLSPIGILAEKMRNLTDVSEILMVRFEARETELDHEILALREENATIKGILQKLQKQQ